METSRENTLQVIQLIHDNGVEWNMGLDDILDSDDIDNMSDDTKAREIVEREISSTWDVIVQAETQKGHRYTDFDTDPDDPEVADDYENLVVSEVARIRRWIAEQV